LVDTYIAATKACINSEQKAGIWTLGLRTRRRAAKTSKPAVLVSEFEFKSRGY